ncbi:MAG: VOC family protein [Rhodobacteraceae bacterium]|nr:VOC family protein [Paracoccaceae bacterium]
MPHVTAIDHLVLTVSDPARTCAFYETALGMRHDSFTGADGTRRDALFFGAQKINLHRHGAEYEPKAQTAAPGTADLCFLTDADPAAWQAHLAATGVAVESGPVARSGATGPIVSLYLRDPDGNLIELACSTPRDHA